MDLHTNSSNNTLYADADGTIAYFHANFIPKRDTAFDWTKPVDGSDPRTDWGPLMSIDESPLVVNPPNGWVYNSNNWPWSAAGASSPKRSTYPAYVDRGVEETPRGYHALRVLEPAKDVTLDSLLALAYDSDLPLFERHMPVLLRAYAQLPGADPLKAPLAAPIAALRGWDYRWSIGSVPTSVAVFWGEDVARRVADQARAAGVSTDTFIADGKADAHVLVEALGAAVDRLTSDFGRWDTPWGEINRFQRLTGDIVHPFDDSKPSIPVGFTSARWGSLASFGARTFPGTKKMYGTTGNSFVAVVEFGDRVRARAITAGGQSGDPASTHFNDQAERYSTGDLREVYFYPEQIAAHTERTYSPGQQAR
jgi:acyl-homoserine lactone acylase PvdQ